jgi:hypothetical protein
MFTEKGKGGKRCAGADACAETFDDFLASVRCEHQRSSCAVYCVQLV